jgi:glycosyltransferase involved in cell wall biosynthesis
MLLLRQLTPQFRLSNFVSGIPVVQSQKRLAVIVSHPIQYYAPLYQRLARRHDLALKVFFTWHSGQAFEDYGFKKRIAWDIPLTAGYDFELIPNVSSDPGTHHFFGLRNPSLVEQVTTWKPDVIHVTGWAWCSHLLALRAFYKKGIPILFRGDSHLLGEKLSGPRWWIKRTLLRHIFSWPARFLVVGAANRMYYEAFGVSPDRLCLCPHSIDVQRFAEPADLLEQEATRWREQLGITPDQCVLLFAGKLQRIKRPLELMRAVKTLSRPGVILLMVGNGELDNEVNAFAAADKEIFRVLPFQNQSRMPVVYRLADLLVVPSAETWGLAVNEALACGRPVLVNNRVGCAMDVVDAACGRIFSFADPSALATAIEEMTRDRARLIEMRSAATKRAWSFDIPRTETALVDCITRMCTAWNPQIFTGADHK